MQRPHMTIKENYFDFICSFLFVIIFFILLALPNIYSLKEQLSFLLVSAFIVSKIMIRFFKKDLHLGLFITHGIFFACLTIAILIQKELFLVNISFVWLMFFVDSISLGISRYVKIRNLRKNKHSTIARLVILTSIPIIAYVFISGQELIEVLTKNIDLIIPFSSVLTIFSFSIIGLTLLNLYYIRTNLKTWAVITFFSCVFLICSFYFIQEYGQIGFAFSYVISITILGLGVFFNKYPINILYIKKTLFASMYAIFSTIIMILAIFFYSDISAHVTKFKVLQLVGEVFFSGLIYLLSLKFLEFIILFISKVNKFVRII